MRHWIISAALVLISTSFALAETPIKVLVAPFTEVNEQQQPDWINRAIQQSVADELASLSGVEVVPNNPAIPLPSTAQAKGAGIKYIVRATIQRLNGDIRVTGRVQNVDDGKTVGGFKATGPQHQLFAIEDSVAGQLKRIVSPMEADLEGSQPIATGPTRGGTGVQTPIQPIRGVYEGSDLQRAIEDRDYIRRTQRRTPDDYTFTQPPMYYPPPTYPGGYGYGYGYGYGTGWPGWGYPWSFGWDGGGDNNVVIINPGGGNGGGGGVTPSHRSRVSSQHVQTQRLRNAAVNPGQSGNFIGPAPARAPHPGTIKK
jgi:TolB-like protein